MAIVRNVGDFSTIEVTIASGESTSDIVNVGGTLIVAIETPSAMDGAGFEFEAARTEDGTFKDVYDEGAQVKIASAASRIIGISGGNAEALSSVKWLRLVSTDGSSTPVNETADRTIYLWLQT